MRWHERCNMNKEQAPRFMQTVRRWIRGMIPATVAWIMGCNRMNSREKNVKSTEKKSMLIRLSICTQPPILFYPSIRMISRVAHPVLTFCDLDRNQWRIEKWFSLRPVLLVQFVYQMFSNSVQSWCPKHFLRPVRACDGCFDALDAS